MHLKAKYFFTQNLFHKQKMPNILFIKCGNGNDKILIWQQRLISQRHVTLVTHVIWQMCICICIMTRHLTLVTRVPWQIGRVSVNCFVLLHLPTSSAAVFLYFFSPKIEIKQAYFSPWPSNTKNVQIKFRRLCIAHMLIRLQSSFKCHCHSNVGGRRLSKMR